MAEAAFWEAREGGMVACLLCPHRCVLAPGKAGLCRVRKNEGGVLALPYYGAISGLAIDPIEKKPLHHFLPGSKVFSVGFVGCNLRCPFCQNWEISQEVDIPVRRMSPAALVEEALRSACPSIAYTYSEPLVHLEFVLESMRLARAAGLRNVLVSNGCVREEAAREVIALTDAANIDLKCWSAEAYRRELGGDLEAVLGFIRLAAASSTCQVEVTTLVVPGQSDSVEGIRSIADFLAGLSPDIPLHLSAYHPAYRRRDTATDPSLLRSLATAAKERLRYVYVGNVVGEGGDTRCPSCGALVIRRRGYDTEVLGLVEGSRQGEARCARCSTRLPIALR